MYAYVWWRIRGAVRGGGEEEGLLYFFKKIEKSAVITRKNALIIFIHGLNVNLCSHLKRCFKSILKEKLRNYPLRGLSFMCYRWMFIEVPYSEKPLLPSEIPAYGFHSWQKKLTFKSCLHCTGQVLYLSDILWLSEYF